MASGKQRKRARKVTVDLAELEVIVGATQERALTPEEHQKLEASHQLLADLLLPNFLNNEKTRSVLGDDEPADPAGEKPKRPVTAGGSERTSPRPRRLRCTIPS
jgi:hypothetical protein